MNFKPDFLIVGSGIMGLALARSIKAKNPRSLVVVLDKEDELAFHGSGRNSGVLHAGFYYSADSLKAKFCVEGNKLLSSYCDEKKLPICKIGKLVVASDEEEVRGLYELARRGEVNGCKVEIISETEAKKIEPRVRTVSKALWSPNTSTVDPKAVCRALKTDLEEQGVQFIFGCRYLKRNKSEILTSKGKFSPAYFINASGLQSDQIAKDFGLSKDYSIVPFKGLYLKYTKNKTDITTNIYPVPNLKHTFLGVHFTKTVDGTIKIGPTAIPALWRENYNWSQRFNFRELCQILNLERKLFLRNSFGFRALAFEEVKKYSKNYLIKLSSKMVEGLDPKGFTEFTTPGIRAQLVNLKTLELVMDFVVESDNSSTHILNAISPGFTCSLPFADYVYERNIANAL